MTQANLAAIVGDLLARLGVPDGISTPVAGALVFLFVFLFIAGIGKLLVAPLLGGVLKRRNLDEHARKPLQKMVAISVYFVAIAVAFGLAGFGDFLQSLATIAAAATLAIGFAMQDVLKNLVAGVFIFTDRPFRIGDWIEWGDHAGIVEDISLRVTRVRTFDNELLTVPNANLTDGVIKNPVAKDRLRVKFVFGIGYDDDMDEATEIIVEEAEAHEEILEDPAPSVRVIDLGESSVGLQARIWIGQPDRSDAMAVRSSYVKAVKERFDEAGIDIPYPNRTIGGELDVQGLNGLEAGGD